MRKHLQSIVCLTVAFVMLFLNIAAAETLSTVMVESAALSSSNPTLDGMVRVYLSSLGSPTSLTLTVSGSYSLSNGTSLTNGESLSVSFNSSTGAITLGRSGAAYSMGSTFTLRRHSTTGSNGIKISEARKPGNLYPGDIQFKAVSQSSGGYKLYTIAYIYIEDYLYGVVPYEMGSSAPIEALKAQAVAARTYTVRMMSARSSWAYDVVDTTGDQTYNGTPTTETNCNTAVDATKGIVLKYGSAYTATYYSSSNGGQTESIYNAWGTSGYSYLGVKDDPFDYSNPYSIVKKTTVYSDANNASNNASLLSLLKTKVVSALSSAGYNASIYNTTIKTIVDISADTPMYSSPSKLYTKMDFTLSVGTYNASNVYVSVTQTVTCDIFNELESLLGMSIQSSNNELWSVVDTSSGFEIQARRYGHGIGMSQRGAMYMGQLGYTYDEILGFYYPGSSRVGCTFTNTILAAGSSENCPDSKSPG
ncbi:MAG TPA: SpoIID/LytB domain-containing protein, partial [Candidatus Limiplasma sp.]|nr:SpoIID/LytB domain-containing protein [Candidatus Limiplasma sp.]